MRITKAIKEDFLWIPFVFAIVYIALPTGMYYTDGLDFAIFLEREEYGAEGFHPHHPLFLPIAWHLYKLFSAVLPSLRSLTFLQVFSSIAGAFGIYLYMRLLVSWGTSRTSAAIGGAFLGSVFAYWHFSSDSNAYTPSFAIMLWGMLIVFSKGDFPMRKAVISAVILAVAVLMHELAIFGVITIGFFLLFNPDKKRYPVLNLTGFITVFSGIVIIFVYISYVILNSMYPAHHTDLITYTASHGFNRYFWTAANIPFKHLIYEVARSHTHLFFHLKPHEVVFFDNMRADPPSTINFYRAFTSISGILVLGSLAAQIGMDKFRLHLLRTLYLWLMIVFGFTVLFMPENHFYRIFYLPPLIAIWGVFLKVAFEKIRFSIKPVTAVAVGAYFIYTLLMGILPDHRKDANPFYTDTLYLNRMVDAKDLLILPAEDKYRLKYFQYFGKCDTVRTAGKLAYLDFWSDIWPMRKESSDLTADFIKSKYESVIISRRALEQGEEYLLFSTYNIPGKHPDIMMIDKDRLVITDAISGHDGYYYRIRVD